MPFRADNEVGSLAPLGIGLFSLLLASSLLIAVASDLLLAHRRLESLAESLALAAYPTAVELELPSISSVPGERLAAEFLAMLMPHPAGEPNTSELWLAEDGTLTARLCGRWEAPFRVLGVASNLNLCAQARARTSEDNDQ